jgi:hypothetical protein
MAGLCAGRSKDSMFLFGPATLVRRYRMLGKAVGGPTESAAALPAPNSDPH